MKTYARSLWSIAVCLLLAFGLPAFIQPATIRAQERGPIVDNPLVPNVESQFASMESHGDPLAFQRGVGDDASVCRHYQSINRGAGPDGTPYLFLTRSGTDTGAHCSGTNIKHFPGELLIVRMDSRDKDGERLRSNLLQRDKPVGETVPPAEDTGVVHIHFNGLDQGPGIGWWPAYSHPGGAQLVGNILIVPLEDKCTTEYEDGHGECLNGGLKKVDSGLILIDVSNPEQPRRISSFGDNLFGNEEHGLGVVGAAQILPGEVPWIPGLAKGGGYLFAITWGESTEVRFAYAVTSVATDGRNVFVIKLLDGTWNEDYLGDNKDKWRDWQMMNFVRDTNGSLYLLGGDKVIDTIPGSPDMVGLFKVNVHDVFNGGSLAGAITYVDENHLHLENPDMGSLEAASSVYVSPSGQLIVYTGPHDNDAPGGSIELGEFRSRYVTANADCGPQLRKGPFQTHSSILEGARLAFSDKLAAYVEPWMTLYPDTGMRGSDKHLTMSYSDQYDAEGNLKENWDNFSWLSFNDDADSFNWCGPKGATLTISKDAGHSGDTIAVTGTGHVKGVSDLEATYGNDWHDKASSMRIEWTRPALSYSLIGGPAGASIDAATGAFSWTPTEAQGPGSYTFTVRVCENVSQPMCDEQQATLTVEEVNAAPVLSPIGNKSLPWGNQLSFSATASDQDLPANTLSFSLVGAPAGANIHTFNGAFTWTPTEAQVGTHPITVKVCDNGSPVLCAEQQFTVEVRKHAAALTYAGETAGQYSDQVSLKASLADDSGGVGQATPLAGKAIIFTIGAQSVSATTDAQGVAQTNLTLTQPAGSYQVAAAFAGDASYLAGSDTDPFTINKEAATIRFDAANTVAVQVAQAGGTSATFTLVTYVNETEPDQPAGAARAGDIALANVAMQLVPVGPGNPVAGTCTPGTAAGTGYSATLPVTCSFNAAPVNTYAVVATVGGGYYQGSAEAVLTVYDPSLGFATGAGWFNWPNSAGPDRTHFGFTTKYNQNGTNPQGNLLLMRHRADGAKYQLKSTSIEAMSLGEDSSVPMGWASFRGRATYQEPGWSAPKDNYTFTVYVEDHDEPGNGADRFWIEIKDPQGAVVQAVSLPQSARDNARDIEGGSIKVPHRGR